MPLARTLIIAGSAALLTLAPSGSALADATAASYSLTGHTLSTFLPDDELLTTVDRARDDHSSVTLVRLDSTSTNTIQYWNHHGAGKRTVADLNLAEGRVLFLKSCEGERRGNVAASDLLESTCEVRWRRGVA